MQKSPRMSPPSVARHFPSQLYERRIAPLFQDERPQSCSQCHLTGLNLELFARETACESMACLVQRGLVNEQDPDASLLLSWIG